jgi:hypothetical protein
MLRHLVSAMSVVTAIDVRRNAAPKGDRVPKVGLAEIFRRENETSAAATTAAAKAIGTRRTDRVRKPDRAMLRHLVSAMSVVTAIDVRRNAAPKGDRVPKVGPTEIFRRENETSAAATTAAAMEIGARRADRVRKPDRAMLRRRENATPVAIRIGRQQVNGAKVTHFVSAMYRGSSSVNPRPDDSIGTASRRLTPLDH